MWGVLTSPRALESWWSPEDLRTTVRRFEVREGGRVEIRLRYLPALLTSDSAEAFRAAGVPITLELRGTVRELVPERLLDLDLRLELDRAAAGVVLRTRFEIAAEPGGTLLRVVEAGSSTPHWRAFGERNLRAQLERVDRVLERRRDAKRAAKP